MKIIFFMKSGIIIEIPVDFGVTKEQLNNILLENFLNKKLFTTLGEVATYNVDMNDVSAFAVKIIEGD